MNNEADKEITTSKIADILAGVDDIPWSKRTQKQKRDTWRAQNYFREEGGGKYMDIPPRLRDIIAKIAKENRDLKNQRKQSKCWNEYWNGVSGKCWPSRRRSK